MKRKRGMQMNLERKEEHLSKKTIAIYIAAISVCIIAIAIVVSMLVLGDDLINSIFGIESRELKTEEEESLLKQGFDGLFTNTIEVDGTYDIKKSHADKDLVYTEYEKVEKNDQNYDLNLYIPFINIEDETIQKYNKEIQDIFIEKAESVYETSNRNIIYSIQYKAKVENGILSLIIKSILKEGANPQQLVIQTYNYDIVNKKEINLEEAINLLGADKNTVQNKILTEINKLLKDIQYSEYYLTIDFYAREKETCILETEKLSPNVRNIVQSLIRNYIPKKEDVILFKQRIAAFKTSIEELQEQLSLINKSYLAYQKIISNQNSFSQAELDELRDLLTGQEISLDCQQRQKYWTAVYNCSAPNSTKQFVASVARALYNDKLRNL